MIIEQTIIEYLSKALTVPVYAEVPDSAPASYVLWKKQAVADRTISTRQHWRYSHMQTRCLMRRHCLKVYATHYISRSN